jgi:hypothetical protein
MQPIVYSRRPFNRPGVRFVMHLRDPLVAVLPGLLSLSIPRTNRAELAVAASVSMDRDLMEVTFPPLQTFYAEHSTASIRERLTVASTINRMVAVGM